VYEDGLQSRDFVHVDDVARAVALLATCAVPHDGPVNVCTGRPKTVAHVANTIVDAAAELGLPVQEKAVTGEFRPGDVRHCFGDPALLQSLGWQPQVTFGEGMRATVRAMLDEARTGGDDALRPVGDAHGELRSAGLLRAPRVGGGL